VKRRVVPTGTIYFRAGIHELVFVFTMLARLVDFLALPHTQGALETAE
jgi:hypothetical protein